MPTRPRTPRRRASSARPEARAYPCAALVRCYSDHLEGAQMNLLYVILIIILVLALLGFVGRGRW